MALILDEGVHEVIPVSTALGKILVDETFTPTPDTAWKTVASDQALPGIRADGGLVLEVPANLHAFLERPLPETAGAVSVRIAPPDVSGERGSGEYRGEARGPNIIAASIEAYILALNEMLGEAHWSGVTEAAAGRRRVPVSAGKARAQRADIDEDEGQHDTAAWFER